LRGLRRWVVRAFCVLLMAAPFVVVVLWLALHHKPVWYRPITLDEAGIEQARRDVISTADFVSDRIVQGDSFDVVLTERSINEWLTALPDAWPDAHVELPPEIRDPAIGLRDGSVRVGAHYAADSCQAILSLRFRLTVSADKTRLMFALDSAYGGSLPLPNAVVREALDGLLRQAKRSRRKPNGTTEPLLDTLQAVRSADDLFEGISLKNRFIWFNGKRPYRIESIKIGNGELRLRVDPL